MPSLPLFLPCWLLLLGRGDSGAVPVGRAGRLRDGRGRPRPAIMVLVALLVLGQRPSLAAPASAEPAEDFGRWERAVNICLLSLSAAALPLASVGATAAPAPAAAVAAVAAGSAPVAARPAVAKAVVAQAGASSGGGKPAAPPATGKAVATAAAGSAPAAARPAVAKAVVAQAGASPAASEASRAAGPGAVSAPTPAPPLAPSSTAAPAKLPPAPNSASRAAGARELLAEPSQALVELELPCRSVRLDQQLAGLLTIRFLPSLRGAPLPATQLAYTGVLTPRSQPLGCRAGRCDLQGDLELQVSAVAVSALDRQGLPTGLPEAFLARGHCSVGERRVHCQARVSLQQSWTAQARW